MVKIYKITGLISWLGLSQNGTPLIWNIFNSPDFLSTFKSDSWDRLKAVAEATEKDAGYRKEQDQHKATIAGRRFANVFHPGVSFRDDQPFPPSCIFRIFQDVLGNQWTIPFFNAESFILQLIILCDFFELPGLPEHSQGWEQLHFCTVIRGHSPAGPNGQGPCHATFVEWLQQVPGIAVGWNAWRLTWKRSKSVSKKQRTKTKIWRGRRRNKLYLVHPVNVSAGKMGSFRTIFIFGSDAHVDFCFVPSVLLVVLVVCLCCLRCCCSQGSHRVARPSREAARGAKQSDTRSASKAR